MKKHQNAVARPTTADEERQLEAEYLISEHRKIDVAIQVLDVMSGLKQMAICNGTKDSLSPKEIAAYNAALDKLEKFIDSP